jgi:hypothetical protein
MVHAGIAGQDGVVRQHLLQRIHDVLRTQRRGELAEVRPHVRFPFRAPALDLGAPLGVLALDRGGAALLAQAERVEELRGENLRVGDDAERRQVVAAELLRVEIDVDELRLGKFHE